MARHACRDAPPLPAFPVDWRATFRSEVLSGRWFDGRGTTRSRLGAVAAHPAPDGAARLPVALPLGPLLHQRPARVAGDVDVARGRGSRDVDHPLRAARRAGDVPAPRGRGPDGRTDRPAQRRTVRDGGGQRLARAGTQRLRHPLPRTGGARGTVGRGHPTDEGDVGAGPSLVRRQVLPVARHRRAAKPPRAIRGCSSAAADRSAPFGTSRSTPTSGTRPTLLWRRSRSASRYWSRTARPSDATRRRSGRR